MNGLSTGIDAAASYNVSNKPRTSRFSTVAWWFAIFSIGLVLLAPLFISTIPPVKDYPNHLARLYVLAEGSEDPELSAIYGPNWAIIPNLAVELIGMPLIRVLPVDVV